MSFINVVDGFLPGVFEKIASPFLDGSIVLSWRRRTFVDNFDIGAVDDKKVQKARGCCDSIALRMFSVREFSYQATCRKGETVQF